MPVIRPLYEGRVLEYPVEAFARTAVSNAVWLTGEWLAQRPKPNEPFTPDLRHLFEVRCHQEALRTIDGLPEDLRHQVFVASFMWRTTDSGRHLFRQLAAHHRAMLREGLQNAWIRKLNMRPLQAGSRIAPITIARDLLPRLMRIR